MSTQPDARLSIAAATSPMSRAERRGGGDDDPNRLLTAQEVANWAQVPLRTVRQWSTRGGGPARIRCGRHVRYRWGDCLAWAESNRVA